MADKSLKSRLLNFADTTTCHGIGSLARSRSLHWRIVWTCALLTAFSILGYQISTLLEKYRSSPIKTKVQIKNEPQAFPSITICNSNPYRKTTILNDDSEIQALKKAYLDLVDYEKQPEISTVKRERLLSELPKLDIGTIEMKPQSDETPQSSGRRKRNAENETISLLTPPDYKISSQSAPIMSLDYDIIAIEKNKSLDRILRERLQLEAYKVPQPATEKYGHQAINMVQDCRFLGQDCSYLNFTRFVSYRYGNCWTFHGDYDLAQERPIMMKRSGTNYGLQLVLNIEANEYMPVLSSASGARVIIHEHGSFPFPSHSGYPVPAGYETDIGITVRKLDRLGEPYGKCRKGDSFAKNTGKQYSDQACKSECIHKRIEDRCRCYMYYRYDDKKFLPEPNVRKCLTDDDVRCTIEVSQMYAQQKFECTCPQSCQETEYLATSALTQWPSASFKDVIVDNLCRREDDLDGQGITNYSTVCNEIRSSNGTEFMNKNFLALSIYFKHLNYESIIQEPAYPLANFLSDIGGTMGLYAGISLLTLIEIVALGCGLMKQISRICGASEKKDPKKAEELRNGNNISEV